MKFINPIAHRLSLAEDEIKALKKENKELRMELAQFRGRKSSRLAGGLSSSPSRKRSTTPEYTIPSYARSTTTSRLRSSPSSTSSSRSTSPSTDSSSSLAKSPKYVSVNGKTCTYRAGGLDVMRFGYLKSTVASRYRDEISLLKRDRLRLASSNAQQPTEEWSWGHSTGPSSYSDDFDGSKELEDPTPAHMLLVMPQEKLDDLFTQLDDLVAQKVIAKRTRLEDRDWTRGSDYRVYIDHDSLFDILSSAEALAKRCLWKWLRTHRPDECLRWVGYRSDVDFGRERLNLMLLRLSTNCFKYRHTQSWQVKCKLLSLIDLRNYLHHFNGKQRDATRMDYDLETVQKLAVLLYDEEAASQARALRDRLRDEAQRTVREIETLMMLKSLPEAGDLWKPHHVDLIRDAASDLTRTFSTYSYSPIVYAAAREWTSREWSWEYSVSQPESEAQAHAEGITTWGPDLPDTTDGDGTTLSAQENHTKLLRRHSVSAGMQSSTSACGGQGLAGSRRRAASMCFGL